MQKINVVFNVGGVDYLPVRAMPYVTGFTVDPTEVVAVLKDPNTGIRTVVFDGAGQPVTVSPLDWASVSAVMRWHPEGFQSGDLKRALDGLPASFVTVRSMEMLLDLLHPSRWDECGPGRVMMGGNYAPFIHDEVADTVMEGVPGYSSSNVLPATGAVLPSPSPSAPTTLTLQGWVSQAQTLARSIIKDHNARGLHPSQRDVSESVAKELQRKGVVGSQKKPITAENVRRNALKGIIG